MEILAGAVVVGVCVMILMAYIALVK
jgi:hypothetical protein